MYIERRPDLEPEIRAAVNEAMPDEMASIGDREVAVVLNMLLESLARDIADPGPVPEREPGLREAVSELMAEMTYRELPFVAPSLSRLWPSQ